MNGTMEKLKFYIDGRWVVHTAPESIALTHLLSGGYEQSGNGQQFGLFDFEEYLKVQAISGSPV
jgi:hypothetical protein